MSFIRSIQKINPIKPNGKTIVYMLGYRGYAWQAKRHLKLLKNRGYTLFVMDFRDVLKRRNPKDLIDLMDETASVLEKEHLMVKDTIIVGVSLGGLVGYNLVRRYPILDKLLVITGGDMTHIPSKKSLQKHWKLSRSELAKKWQRVNIYTPVGTMKDKHIIMLLPTRDRMIDPEEVANEITNHTHLNDFRIIYTPGGHFRTIIRQTIISPKQSLPLIERLAKL
ncbi:MAG TPA: alpha/beta hydrolase [Candidatus Saccharimonadales bacterium]|nr:alpha/beta hydrolase [Candidatus Saccharimonadales bacterium]